ncbi:TAXI family TRAP transporter solute-binding subunit [Ectothiorhodospiraceae bacterium BW-2]|nr:TAXI family TRAP transporter solute-binding subunit [Ectothiorhodospiraceae bacterium BW-2]
MIKQLLPLLLGLLNLPTVSADITRHFPDCPAFPNYCIVTGSPEYTYHKIGQSLAQIVAADADLTLTVMPGGSIENIQRMRYQNGVKLAIVQSDVILHYKKLAQHNREVNQLLAPLRVMLPLYPEEIHLLVRADAKLDSLRDIEHSRIAVGPKESGSGLTAVSIYELLFGRAPDNIHFFDSHDEALRAVTIDETADVWVMTVGQGTSRLQFPAEAAARIKLLRFNADDPIESRVLDGPYFRETLHQSSYPWLREDTPVVAVKAFLITQAYHRNETRNNINALTRSLCRNFARLQREIGSIWRDKRGNPVPIKWRDVPLTVSPLPGGWQYSEDVLAAFATAECGLLPPPVTTDSKAKAVRPAATQGEGCSSEEMLLGFCP